MHSEDIGGNPGAENRSICLSLRNKHSRNGRCQEVAEMALMEPGVVHAEDYQYMCSEAGQALIAKAIKEKGLTGMVVCSCSPRMHEATFRKAAERAGLNPYMVEIANIREHCSWIHKDMEEATKKSRYFNACGSCKS